MDCTIVVPSHRGAHRLPVLLDALVRQDYHGSWEVVVVLDGILDESREILDQYRRKLPLRVLEHETSQGVISAMNSGTEQARGRIVIRCDDDLTPARDFVSRHMSHHVSGARRGVVGPTRDVFPETPYARAYGRPANERALRAAYARSADKTWISWAANNSAPKEDLVAVGGFDPRFVYGQDSELGYRLFQRGLEIVVDPGLEVEHRGPSSTAATRIPRAFVSGASRRLFNRIHPEVHEEPAQPKGLKARIWSALVAGLSSALRTQNAWRVMGARIDALVRWIPSPWGYKLVALLVESSGRAGLLHGADDLSSYKKQKTAELARELGGNRLAGR
jgi:glycosyltransferase involved in cell wall biosynthesis